MLPPEVAAPVEVIFGMILWAVYLCLAALLMLVGGMLGWQRYTGQEARHLGAVLVILLCAALASAALSVANWIVF